MTKDFTVDDIWQAQRFIFIYIFIYFHPVKHNQDFEYSALVLIFFLYLLLCSHFEDVKLLKKTDCFASGTVKFTNTILGVRHRGFVCIKEIPCMKRVGLGPGLI